MGGVSQFCVSIFFFFSLNVVLFLRSRRMCLKAWKGIDPRLPTAQPWHLGSFPWALLVRWALSGTIWIPQGSFKSTDAALRGLKAPGRNERQRDYAPSWNHLACSRHTQVKARARMKASPLPPDTYTQLTGRVSAQRTQSPGIDAQ